jgi:2',3'-cyclic-nucleotide 2'-phosphodiesterase (5'-nucleotidase family)
MHKKLLSFLFLITLAACPFAAVVNIYHTSDTHGHYFPQKENNSATGGFAALAAVIAKDKTPYLLLDSGDFTSGTAEAKETKGMLSVQFMNALGYHAATIGNHEADFGYEAMLKNIKAAQFDILAANITDKITGSTPCNIKPYKIYNLGGIRIAVIGFARDTYNTGDMKIGGNKKALKKTLSELRGQEFNAIVVLMHESIEDTSNAVKNFTDAVAETKGIDLVLGGHAHKLIQGRKINNITFIESGENLKGVSKISLTFNDETGILENISTRYMKLNIDVTGEEPVIKSFSENNYNSTLDKPFAHVNEDITKLNKQDNGHIDSPLGNMLADAVKFKTGTEISIQNTGSIRTDLKKGPLTHRVIFEIFPFENFVTTLEVDGKFIKKLLLLSLKEDRSQYQYSGLQVKYRYKNKKPEIVEILINGTPLEEGRLYKISTNSFIAQGLGEGYMFKNIKEKNIMENLPVSDVLADYLKNLKSSISSPSTGRIQKVK